MKDYNNTLANSNNNVGEDTTSSPTAAGGYHSSAASSSPSITGNPSTTTNSSSNTTTTTTTDDQKSSSLLFDYVDQQIDEDLVCPICLHPFIDPITHSSCGNTFCSQCIQSIPNCPLCSEADFKKNCTSSAKMIRNMLDKLKVKCDMCKNTVLRGELKDHREKYCPLHDAYKQVDELKLKLEEEFKQKNEQLKAEYFELIQQLKAEKEQSIKEAKEHLIMKERELILKVKSSQEELQKERELFDNQVLVRKKFESANKPIHLNVGGSIITTSLGLFLHNEREPENLFKKMFSGQVPIYETPSNKFLDSSVYFIECDPLIFKHILEWLKFGRLAIELSIDMKNSLLDASVMFQLNNLSKKLEESNNNNSPSQQEKMKMSQFDFMNMTNLARSQKTTLNLNGLDFRGLVLQNTNLEQSEIILSDFSGMNLSQAKFKKGILRGCNFSGCDLTSVDFNGCDLSECNFSNAILKNADMSNTNLSRASFENAKLEKTKLQSCKFEQTVGLNGLKLISLDFTKSTFFKCQMNGCNLTSSILSGGVTFKKCDLTDAILTKAEFTNSKFEHSSLKSTTTTTTRNQSGAGGGAGTGGEQQQVNFTGSEFKGCNFSNKQFINSNFKNCKLSECNLENTMLKSTDMSCSTLSGVSFEKSQIEETKFQQCKFDKMKASGSKLISSDLSKSSFVECSFKDADLSHSNLSGCNLSNQDFTGFQFKNVNFSNSILDGSNFENATFDKCSIKLHFKKNNLKDCKLIDCNLNGSTFEEINGSQLLKTSYNECTFKKCDLTLLKDLSPFKGSTFDECLFNFQQFTNNSIENIQFKNIDFSSEHLINFDFKKVQCHNCKLDSKPFIPLPTSSIVCGDTLTSTIISHTNSKSIPQLLYRGSRDGFKAIDFHSKCDNQGPTLTIIKSSEPYNQIFGGFTTQSWKSSGGQRISDGSAFIFKIDGNNQFRKFNIKQDQKHYAIYTGGDYLPVFGGGCDIFIKSDCNLNNNSYSNFGHTYELPNNEYQPGSEKANSYLAGSSPFKVSEIEVFKIIQ